MSIENKIGQFISRIICSTLDNNKSESNQYKGTLIDLSSLFQNDGNLDKLNENSSYNLKQKRIYIINKVKSNFSIFMQYIKKYDLYRKELISLYCNFDKFLLKCCEDILIQSRSILDFSNSKPEKMLILKTTTSDIMTETFKRLRKEIRVIKREESQNQGKTFMKKLSKFLKLTMNEKNIHTRFFNMKNEEINILKKVLAQSKNISINLDNLKCSFLIIEHILQDYNILSLIDYKNTIVDKVIDNSPDVLISLNKLIEENFENNILNKKRIPIEDVINSLSYFAERIGIDFARLDNDIEEYDFKLYLPESVISPFIVDEINHLMSIFSLNSNIMKLYESCTGASEFYSIPDKDVYRVLKISRTPAYGIKTIIIGNEKCSLNLKPIQVIFLLYSQFFADLVIKDEIKVKSILKFLQSIHYTKNFYQQNYSHFFPKLYVINRKVLNIEDNNIILQSLTCLELTAIFNKFFGIQTNFFSKQIFQSFNFVKEQKKFDIKIISFNKFNENIVNKFFLVCLFQNQVDFSKDEKTSIEAEMIFNNICYFSKQPLIEINKIGNPFIKSFIRSPCIEKESFNNELKNVFSHVNSSDNVKLNYRDIFSFYLEIKKQYNNVVENKITLSKELNCILVKLEKQTKDSNKKVLREDVIKLLKSYNDKTSQLEEKLKLTLVLIDQLTPIVSLRNSIGRQFCMNNKLAHKILDSSREKTQEDNENSSMKVSQNKKICLRPQSNQKKPSLKNIKKEEKREFSYKSKLQNYKNVTSNFPNILQKRPTTVNVTSKLKNRNEKNIEAKENISSTNKNNYSFSNKNNVQLNNSYFKKSSNDLIKEKNNSTIRIQNETYFKGIENSIKKTLFKNLDYLIYKSNKI